MKTIFGLSLLVLLSTIESRACSPAPRIVMQQSNLQRVLDSREVSEALAEHMSSAIEKIEWNKGITFTLKNKCQVIAHVKYNKPAHGGACPTFESVSVESKCP